MKLNIHLLVIIGAAPKSNRYILIIKWVIVNNGVEGYNKVSKDLIVGSTV
jgi:hypothetical protein